MPVIGILGNCTGCCCCAEYVGISGAPYYPATPFKRKNKATGEEEIGHTFTTIFMWKWVKWPVNYNAKCTVEWLERRSRVNDPHLGVPANEWRDFADPGAYGTAPIAEGALEKMPKDARQCVGRVQWAKDVDSPFQPASAPSVMLEFRIVFRSARGCPCDRDVVFVTAEQFLSSGGIDRSSFHSPNSGDRGFRPQ